MCGFAFRNVIDGDQPVAAAVAPPGAEAGADVIVEHGVDAAEHTGAHVYALVPSCSSATPGQIMMVPGSFSPITSLTANAARMLSGVPEL